jgi:hypothetical protein
MRRARRPKGFPGWMLKIWRRVIYCVRRTSMLRLDQGCDSELL